MNIKIGQWTKYQGVEIRWDDKKERLNFNDSLYDGKWHHIKLYVPELGNTRIQLVISCGGKNIFEKGRLFINNITISRGKNISIEKPEQLETLNKLKLPELEKLISKSFDIKIPKTKWQNNFDFFDTCSFNTENIFISYSDSLKQKAYQEIIIPRTQYYEFSAKVFSYTSASVRRISMYNITKDNYLDQSINSKSDNTWQNINLLFFAEKNDTIRISAEVDKDSTSQLVLWKQIQLVGLVPNKNEVIEKQLVDNIDTSGLNMLFHEMQNKARASKTVNQNKNRLLSDRVDRWEYALELYKEYSITRKIFGGGFDYLFRFKDKFNIQKQDFDYPHNIFLSTLLYSGIIGLLVLLFVLGKTVYLYIKYKQYVLLLSYFLTLGFIMASSDSIFELPLFVAFIMLPYLQHLIAKKEKFNIEKAEKSVL
ncbi:MAG: O-antigen ligase family protein [Bacteroidales bacterium]|nr:O-antigen ligase family protein [Bacteroidales bacterium]